jgi:hypothetical protein
MNGWETDWSRDVLERIVALLFSLAGLADLGADAPFLRRRRVLGILSRGEAEARAFLIGISTGEPVQADALQPAGDAACLAVRFRALALLLCVLLAGRFARPGADGPRTDLPSHGICAPAVRRPDAPALPAPDTS